MRSLAVARERARRARLGQVSFQQGALRELNFDRPFDAVIGRFVLMYVGDPVDAVRRLARHVRSGGIVAFAEFQFDGLMRTWPSMPGSLYQKSLDWVLRTFAVAGVATSMGTALPSTFRDAGLEPADAYVHTPLGGRSRACGVQLRRARSPQPASTHGGVRGRHRRGGRCQGLRPTAQRGSRPPRRHRLPSPRGLCVGTPSQCT